MNDLELMTEKYEALKQRNKELVRKANAKVNEQNEIIEKLQADNLRLKSELNKIKFGTQQEEKEFTEPRITLMSQNEIDYNNFIH